MRAGLLFGLAAYGAWGVAPIFWRAIASVDALQILAHRLLWAWAFFAGWAWLRGRMPELRATFADRHLRVRLAVAAVLLCGNWFVFVYAVLTDRVLDASLGYFINPLVSVALGRFVLGERLTRLQAVAVVLAAVGIAVAAWVAGGLPWISVVLAGSFGGYGLMRKTVRVPAIVGSTFETTLLAPFALVYLAWVHAHGDGVLANQSRTLDLLLVSTGIVTALPLLAFVAAARRLTLTTLGFLQYLAPSLQMLLALALFGERLSASRLTAFGFVWLALALFATDAVRRRPRASRRPAHAVDGDAEAAHVEVVQRLDGQADVPGDLGGPPRAGGDPDPAPTRREPAGHRGDRLGQ